MTLCSDFTPVGGYSTVLLAEWDGMGGWSVQTTSPVRGGRGNTAIESAMHSGGAASVSTDGERSGETRERRT